MDKNLKLRKKNETNFCFQKQGTNLIILLDDNGDVCILNEISQFLYNNCENKTVKEVVDLLFEQLLDKENLEYDEIYCDCLEAIESMRAAGVLEIYN